METYRKKSILLFVVLFLFWVLFTWKLELPALVVGLALSFVVTRISHLSFFPTVHELYRHKEPPLHFRFREAITFFPLYVLNILLATAQVALLALKPHIELKPGIVKLETSIRNKTTLVILANQITLTPGTLTVDIDLAHHNLFVHSINLRTLDADSVRKEVKELEERLRRMME